MRKTVVVADDHPIFLRGLCRTLKDSPDFSVAGEANDGKQALSLIDEYEPDIAILDISMPEVGGLQMLERIAGLRTKPRTVMLTLYDDPGMFREAMRLGAIGYLLKEDAEHELLTCLRNVSQGRRYVSDSLAWMLEENVSTDPLAQLTETERRVLALVADHRSSREIGKLLAISHRTVHHHRANIAQKFGLRGTNALLRFAIEHRHLL